jgi:hypothetical protein
MPPIAVETMGMMLVDGQISHTDPIRADMIKEAGTTAPVEFSKDDLREVFDAMSKELEKAETTVREWHDPDIWELIRYEPPVADV